MANFDKIAPNLNGDPTTQIPNIPSTPPPTPPSELELKRFDRPSVSGDALADAFGVGAFNKK